VWTTRIIHFLSDRNNPPEQAKLPLGH